MLTTKDYKNCTITLIGLEEWQQFDNIDLEYFQTLNVFMAVNQFVAFEEESTKRMIKNYYDATSTYPSSSSFLGFDVAHYFGSKLKQSGSVFTIGEDNPKLTSLQFNFLKTGIESGYENNNTNVLGFENYTLKKVN